MAGGMGERIRGRLERLDKEPARAAREAGLPEAMLSRVLADEAVVRGRHLVRLAEVLDTSVGYLVGLDPDDTVPAEWLEEDQTELGLLALDEEALLRAYRRLDRATQAALLLVATRMSPDPDLAADRRRAG